MTMELQTIHGSAIYVLKYDKYYWMEQEHIYTKYETTLSYRVQM